MIHEWNEDFGACFAKKKEFPEDFGGVRRALIKKEDL